MRKKTIAKYLTSFKVAPSGCWEWTGNVSARGYGHICYWRGNSYHSTGAHRFFYSYHKRRIKEGMNICHTCDNRLCVNPEHLWEGTQSANVKDMVRKQRGLVGCKNALNRYTEEQIKYVRDKYTAGEATYEQLAKELGCNKGHIGKIIRREMWQHV